MHIAAKLHNVAANCVQKTLTEELSNLTTNSSFLFVECCIVNQTEFKNKQLEILSHDELMLQTCHMQTFNTGTAGILMLRRDKQIAS